MRQDAMSTIRADLLRRVDGLASQRGHLSVPRIHDEVDQIRHIARAFHLDSVESLAGTLQSALSLHGLGLVVLSYLDLLRDALIAQGPAAEAPAAEAPTAAILPLTAMTQSFISKPAAAPRALRA